ncbi:hypothetical protein PAXINDRAFT_115626 [Paxillus involutus ATCC 200175]|uniref:HAT C-terminal dimerisation domain-containing protein n=1 Tax=Paxillus involutus ATCC 200175 TaxID=664439 RepID=A0A0C9U601_PAXIN|nr:hypothetical protein PAXINDRAFT_115626 [Paxillus involutus ATCC 200175]
MRYLHGLTVNRSSTSTGVEHVFSQRRHLLHFTRNRLSPSSSRAVLCRGIWLQCNLVGRGLSLTLMTRGSYRPSRYRTVLLVYQSPTAGSTVYTVPPRGRCPLTDPRCHPSRRMA